MTTSLPYIPMHREMTCTMNRIPAGFDIVLCEGQVFPLSKISEIEILAVSTQFCDACLSIMLSVSEVHASQLNEYLGSRFFLSHAGFEVE